METMKLEQLIQATSGLSNRKETPVLVNGQPITEIRISIKDGAQCVNLVSENPDAAYDVRCAFDEEHNEWLYVISMPEKDKMVLEEICKGYLQFPPELGGICFTWTYTNFRGSPLIIL